MANYYDEKIQEIKLTLFYQNIDNKIHSFSQKNTSALYPWAHSCLSFSTSIGSPWAEFSW